MHHMPKVLRRSIGGSSDIINEHHIIMKQIKFFSTLFLMAALFSSCTHWKDIAYFQNSDTVDLSQSSGLYDARIMPKDELTITVNTLTPEVANVFNLHVQNSYGGGNLSTGGGRLMPYLVDNDGYINFPILGRLKVIGMTKRECEQMILKRIRPYMAETENPIVTVRMSSFSVTVLGEVGRPGVLSVGREKISILEALAQAGDATIYGIRNPVKLIREDAAGRREIHKLDLNDADILNSPYYYLQQNDVVYVEPRKQKITYANVDRTRTWISFGTLLITTGTLIYTISKK